MLRGDLNVLSCYRRALASLGQAAGWGQRWSRPFCSTNLLGACLPPAGMLVTHLP